MNQTYLSESALALRAKVAKLLAVRLKATPESARVRPAQIRLTSACAAELYQVGRGAAEEAWPGVQALEREGLISVQFAPRSSPRLEPWHRDPQVLALPDSYEALARIGGVALRSPAAAQLQASLQQEGIPEETARHIALRAPAVLLALPTAEALVRLQGLKRLAGEAPNLYLREAASRLFETRSKVLDGRTDWVTAVLGVPCPWRERPLQLQVAIGPGGVREVLFVENLVSFERLRMHAPIGVAFIYSAGFKGSAGRVATGELAWYAAPSVSPEQLQELHEALFGTSSAIKIPLAFFGDLDYAGLAILKSLRQSWPVMQAWQPGYAALLALLEGGVGHAPEAAEKAEQRSPGPTGCPYADEVLAPALARANAFVDQEAWQPDQACPARHAGWC